MSLHYKMALVVTLYGSKISSKPLKLNVFLHLISHRLVMTLYNPLSFPLATSSDAQRGFIRRLLSLLMPSQSIVQHSLNPLISSQLRFTFRSLEIGALSAAMLFRKLVI